MSWLKCRRDLPAGTVRDLRRLAILIAWCVCTTWTTSAAAAPQKDAAAALVYAPLPVGAAGEEDADGELDYAHAVAAVIDLINDVFVATDPVTFVFGAEDGPLYDPEHNQVLMPYAFFEEIRQRFRDADYGQSGVDEHEAATDALMHTLFHEFAHAAIVNYDLPIVGKEEDAADNLATVLLIEYFEDGQEIAISAADLFDLESDDVGTPEAADYWDEHSLDIQRYFSTLCHVYGSDPERYADLPQTLEFSTDRAELCIEEYENLARSWMILLEPHLRESTEAPD